MGDHIRQADLGSQGEGLCGGASGCWVRGGLIGPIFLETELHANDTPMARLSN